MKSFTEGIQYACRYTLHKFDAFRAFGPVDDAGHHPHSVVKPLATYSPWRADVEFRTAFAIVRSKTLVDMYRCYDLWSLAGEAGKLSSGDILEVGVWRGGTGCLIARRAQLAEIPAHIYLCDTFQGVVKAGNTDLHYDGGEHADTSEATVESLANELGLDNVKILRGVFPDETGEAIAGRRFRMCHIDVDVYESARQILDWVWPRLVLGGMVVFDDYGFLSTGGVTSLVNEERSKMDRLMLHNLNGHAIFVKIGTEARLG